ncbi:hypothetical protein QA600_05810, partial [Natronococcus sp. A-GB1]|uniref:hypothetical protein n=1 Tax=Natronococcus sp. A-GB1 TaxID=3037648 RepID=UPI00241C6634
ACCELGKSNAVWRFTTANQSKTVTADGGVETDNVTPTSSVSTLQDYSPDSDTRLSRAALETLPRIDENPEINRGDVPKGAIPSDVEVKQELIAAVVRHEHNAITREKVMAVAEEFVGVGSPYKRETYVDEVLEGMGGVYVKDGRLEVTFVDESAALAWMDKRIEEDGAYADEDVRPVIARLYRDHEVSVEKLQPYASACRLGNVDAFA